jgi:hypothetical protein
MIEIRRQNKGRARTRFGILLSPLKPRHQRILLENSIIQKNSTDDRFIRCILRMEDARINISYLRRPYIDRAKREIVSFFDLRRSLKYLDWNCAYCKVEIKSEIHNYKPENFTCKKCFDYYVKNSKFVNQRLVDESLKFTAYHKKLLKADQDKFIKYIKKQNDAS